MPRRSGTDVLFRNGRVRRFFLPGAFCFSDAVLSVPPCAAPLFRPVPRCHPRSASVAVLVCVVSPLVSCLRLCLVAALALCRAAVPVCAALSSSVCIGCRPRLCRVAAPICVALSSAVCVVSPFRFADGRRRRILRTVWRGICAGCGALAAFPCVAAIPVGSPARFFVALNFQISFYFRTFARL